MKYFTMDNWIGSQHDNFDESESDRLRQAYWDYWDGIKAHVPPRLKEFYESYTTHDGVLQWFEIKEERMTVHLSVARIESMEEEWIFDDLSLQYDDLLSFESISNRTPGFNESLYGDLGYDEIEKLSDCIEHRWLFSTGIEFRIRFRDFDFQLAPIT